MEPEQAANARQWPSKHAPVATDKHAIMEELQEMVFSMWSMPNPHNKDHGGVSWSQRLVVSS